MKWALLLFVLVGAALAAGASAATSECAGVPTCIDVPGPWVAVPAHGVASSGPSLTGKECTCGANATCPNPVVRVCPIGQSCSFDVNCNCVCTVNLPPI